MKKSVVALVTVTLALMGCGTIAGPSDTDDAANAAKARRALDAASQDRTTPSLRLSSN